MSMRSTRCSGHMTSTSSEGKVWVLVHQSEVVGQEPILAKLIGVFSSPSEVEAAKQSLLRFDGYREVQAGFRSHALSIDEGIDGELSHEILFGR